MAGILIRTLQSSLLIVDAQSGLLPHVFEGSRLQDRICFIAQMARLLQIPVFVTEQNPSKMGRTTEEISRSLGEFRPYEKMCFSATGNEGFMADLKQTQRNQVVVVGLETHICVGQTVDGLLRAGYEVIVCPDGVSARTQERHKLGMERIRDSRGLPAHTESVAYEWLESAENPRFRDALKIVKQFA